MVSSIPRTGYIRVTEACHSPKIRMPKILIWRYGRISDSTPRVSFLWRGEYWNAENEKIFPIFLFAAAAFIGLIMFFFQKGKFQLKSLIGGIYLGIPNYFSLYFVLKALSAFENNGAVFFPIYNVGIIMLSSFTAMIIFKEKLSKINFLGLGLSVLALFLLSYQEIIEYFSY